MRLVRVVEFRVHIDGPSAIVRRVANRLDETLKTEDGPLQIGTVVLRFLLRHLGVESHQGEAVQGREVTILRREARRLRVYDSLVRIERFVRFPVVARREVDDGPLPGLVVIVQGLPRRRHGGTVDGEVQGLAEGEVGQGHFVPVRLVGDSVKETTETAVESDLVGPFPSRLLD